MDGCYMLLMLLITGTKFMLYGRKTGEDQVMFTAMLD